MPRKRQRCDEGGAPAADLSPSASPRQTLRSKRPVITSVKAFPSDAPAGDMLAYYSSNQILHIKDYLHIPRTSNKSSSVIHAIRALFADAPSVVEKSFTLESSQGELTAAAIFGTESCPPGVYYSSFIAQGGKKSLPMQAFKSALPMADLAFGEGVLQCTKPIWLFVGKNEGTNDLRGRNEHVDAVTHDGTWHVQTNGSKVWHVRPADTSEWGPDPENRLVIAKNDNGEKLNNNDNSNDDINDDEVPRLRIECNAGDVLLINTRIWWHQTSIPSTCHDDDAGNKDRLSISYARDFFSPSLRLHYRPPHCGDKAGLDGERGGGSDCRLSNDFEKVQEQEEEEEEEYTNLEGLYASKNVASGDIVLMEDEMPDCALPRSENPTCVVEWLEGGTGALVALVDLQVGDWLTIAPSEDEGDSDDEEECEVEDDSEDE